jgi:hypothetical protein
VNFLVKRFSVVPDNIRRYTGVQSEVDVRLVLGRDYASSAP